MGSSERGKSLNSCLEAAEAAGKWYQKGPEGPEAGRKRACDFADENFEQFLEVQSWRQ